MQNLALVNGHSQRAQTAPHDRAWRELFETLGVPLVGISREAMVTAWNRAAVALFGYACAEIVGRPVSTLAPPAERERAAELIRRALDGEHPEAIETERVHRDGHAVPVLLTLVPLRSSEGEITGAVATLQDLRRDRRAEAALRQSEEAFRALVERCPEPIFVHRGGTLVYVNPALLSLTGYSREEMLGHSILETLVHAGEREVVERRIEEIVVTDQPLPPLEVRVQRRDGSLRIAETVAVRIDYGGEPAALVIGRDVTERKELQSRLLVSDRMASIGTLAAGIAHEINNPLAYVLSNLERVTEEIQAIAGASPSERLRQLDKDLAQARGGADRIARIVRGLRIFSRAEEERRERLDVHQVLEMSVNMSWNEIRHRARLVRAFGAVPEVEADEARLCQVFINLLVNAAQAIREGECGKNEIRIATATGADGRAIIEVHDTGAGVPAALRSRIFDPFFTTKPVGVGTGLGLSICHGIVTGLGGEISLEPRDGPGSSFRVTLPAASRTLPAQAPPPASRAPRRARILVVDDDAYVAAAIAGMLPEHEVTLLHSGREALERIGEGFEVIICDLMMPDLTGMDLYEEVSRLHPELAQRFVFVTGGAFTARARAFLDGVGVGRLEKPFRSHELRALVHVLLRG